MGYCNKRGDRSTIKETRRVSLEGPSRVWEEAGGKDRGPKETTDLTWYDRRRVKEVLYVPPTRTSRETDFTRRVPATGQAEIQTREGRNSTAPTGTDLSRGWEVGRIKEAFLCQTMNKETYNRQRLRSHSTTSVSRTGRDM